MENKIKLDVFGRIVLAVRKNGIWEVFFLDSNGKRRTASDILIPHFIDETEIERYLSDLCHEWATEKNPHVRRLD